MRIGSVFILLALFLFAACLQEKFNGIAPAPNPAPEFTLTDQFGERVSLSDFRGKVVVLSFLYTSCPTVCPIIMTKFAQSAESLKSEEVIFLGITVDPERDSPEKLRNFLEDRQLSGKMQFFLTGSGEELEAVWSNYNIYVNKSEADASGYYEVDHSAIVYVIDKKGNLRLIYPGVEWYPKFLVADIERLLNEEKLIYRLVYDIPKT